LNNLGTNEKNMLYISKALKINTSIEISNLNENNLGEDEKNMMYISESLKINTSIKELNL